MGESILVTVGVIALVVVGAVVALGLAAVGLVALLEGRDWAHDWVGRKFGFDDQIKNLRAAYWRDHNRPPPTGTPGDIEEAIRAALPDGVELKFRWLRVPGMPKGVLKVEVRHG